MDMAAMWPGPSEQTFVLPSHGGSTWNLASIGLAISKEKKFENVESKLMNDLDHWYPYWFMPSFS